MVGHRPADDLPREAVDHRGEIEPPLPRADERDVGHPQLVRAARPEIALDEVVGGAHAGNADRRAAALAAHQPRQTGGPHKPLDALAADVDAVGSQLGVDSASAISATAGGVGALDALDEPDVLELAVAGRPALPGVKP